MKLGIHRKIYQYLSLDSIKSLLNVILLNYYLLTLQKNEILVNSNSRKKILYFW